MTELEGWLQQATRHLSKDSAAQVRSEIQAHYESAREAAMSGGASADEADRLAVRDLGEAEAANCRYREVLLTSAEARMLREGNWEARAVCSVSWLRWLLLAMLVADLSGAISLFVKGEILLASTLFTGGILIALLLAAPVLPIYTPSRARAFRLVKWVVMLATLGLAFAPNALEWSWLLFSCLWPLAWIEWTRISIRRKLPAAQWPKQLYL